MRPDTFTELIRRKLESIRPDVTERDWTRMQSSLQQAGLSGPSGVPVAGVGSVPSWLVGVAGIVTAALLTIMVWQRAEINTLREKLTQHTTLATTTAPGETDQTAPPDPRPDQAPSADRQPDQSQLDAARPDTVYVTRYVPVKPVDYAESGKKNRSVQSGSVSGMNAATPGPAPSDNQSITTNTALRTPTADTPDAPARTPGRALPGKTLSDNTVPGNEATNTGLSVNDLPGKVTRTGQPRLAAEGVGKSEIRTSQTNTSVLNQSQTARPGINQPIDRTSTPQQRPDPTASLTETRSMAEEAAINPSVTSENQVYALAQTRTLLTRPINWNARLARRFPRAVSIPPAVSQPESPASQSVAKQVTAFRIGIGSDVRASYLNTGLVAETVLGGRWVLSAGLVRSGSTLGSFVTDDDYDYRTRHNFRHEFAPGFDLKREIYGIDVRSVRYQIPVSIGYRIPVSQSLAILPSVGAYLDLSNDVQVTFSYRVLLPRPSYETATVQGTGPVSLFNAYTAGAALEWQQKHWVVQGGLLFARPLYSDMNGTAAPSLGGRMRLLYQF